MELYSSCNELKGPNWKTSFLVVTLSPLWDIFGHGQPGHFSARSWRKSWKTRFMSSVASWIVPWGSQLMNSEDGNDGNEKFTTPVPSSCGVLTSDFCWHWLISQVRFLGWSWGEKNAEPDPSPRVWRQEVPNLSCSSRWPARFPNFVSFPKAPAAPIEDLRAQGLLPRVERGLCGLDAWR